MLTLRFNKVRILSVIAVLTVLASMVFSANPLSFAVAAVFFAIVVFLVMNLVVTNSKAYPWIVLFFYLFVLIYILVFSVFLLLFADDFTPRNFLTSLYLPSLLVLSILLFGKDPRAFNLFVLCFVVFLLFASYKVIEARSLSLIEFGWIKQTNWANFVGSSLAFAFVCKRRSSTFILLLVGTFIVLMGLKRSGILVVSLFWLIYFLPVSGIRQFVGNSAIALVLGGVALALSVYHFGSDEIASLWDSALARMGNVFEDGGSGRAGILVAGMTFWMNSEFASVFLGQGHAAFQRSVGTASSLHNDFAELLMSYGLIGVLFIVTLYTRLFYLCLRLRLQSNRYFHFSLAVAFAFFVYSNVAGLYFYPIFFCPLIVAYGYLESICFRAKAHRLVGRSINRSEPNVIT